VIFLRKAIGGFCKYCKDFWKFLQTPAQWKLFELERPLRILPKPRKITLPSAFWLLARGVLCMEISGRFAGRMVRNKDVP
jgi:hypothetical protein